MRSVIGISLRGVRCSRRSAISAFRQSGPQMTQRLDELLSILYMCAGNEVAICSELGQHVHCLWFVIRIQVVCFMICVQACALYFFLH